MSDPKFNNPAHRIETERLIVRCYQPSDVGIFADAITESVEHLKPWMPWAHDEPRSPEEYTKSLLRFRGLFDLNQDYVYGIFNSDETKLVGGTGLHTRLGDSELEIGYWIHKDFINQGLVTESTSALIRVAFEIMHVHRIEIHCDPENLASAAIPRKLGFTHEGTLRANTPFVGRWRDTMIWSLLENEYPDNPASKTNIKVFDANGAPVL
jgi:RimJ/RimL family protein N-acetyltransferase